MKSSGKVTVKDIAQQLNVSLSTVNKALTGKKGISEKRRAEIIEAAVKMGYEVNHVAQSLSRKPISIGIIIPGEWEKYFGPIADGMKSELRKLSQSNVNGEFIHVYGKDDLLPAFSHFSDKGVDLIIYCPSLISVEEEVCTYIAKDTCPPVMLVGADCDRINSICTVSIDSVLSGRMAAEFLFLILKKNAKITALVGSKDFDTHSRKISAFSDRAKELGLSVCAVHETGDEPKVMADCVRKTLRENPDLGGIYIATGNPKEVVDCFAHGEVCPEIVATDVYEDIRESILSGKVAATIFQNQALMGKLSIEYAYKYLVEKSSYRISPSELPEKIFVTPHLFLASNLECFRCDDGNDYRAE